MPEVWRGKFASRFCFVVSQAAKAEGKRLSSGILRMKPLLGPFLLSACMGSLCATGITTMWSAACIAFAFYLSGIMPENEYFPLAWFEWNIFGGLYRIYCSNVIGYSYLRKLMHSRQRLPHSDYRHGVRCLDEVELPMSSILAEIKPGLEFYKRGGGMVDLKGLAGAYQTGYTGVVVVPVPLLTDNYAYLILSFATRRCAVVDPADPLLVLYMLRVVRNLTKVEFLLTDILTTHKHWDHAGGNLEIQQQVRCGDPRYTELVDPRLKIYGSVHDRPHACTDFVEEGDILTVAGGGVAVAVFASPGHTVGSVLFLAGNAGQKSDAPQRLALFTGDCIFCGGCGAMFEVSCVEEVLKTFDLFHGERIRMHPVTNELISLDNVLVYVGHEYTERLLSELIQLHEVRRSEVASEGGGLEMQKFRSELKAAMKTTRLLRSTHVPDDISRSVPIDGRVDETWALPACTVPSTLAIERRINSLLTIRRSVLEGLRETRFPQSIISSVIYKSVDRHILE